MNCGKRSLLNVLIRSGMVGKMLEFDINEVKAFFTHGYLLTIALQTHFKGFE